MSQALFTAVAAACTSGLSATPVRPQQRRTAGQTFLGRDQSLLGLVDRFLGMRNFFSRHGAGLAETLTPDEVSLRTTQIRAPLGEDSVQLVAAGKHRVDLAYGLGELILGLLESDTGIGIVEAHDLLTDLHVIGLVGIDGDDRAADLGADIDLVAGDISIVGVLIETAVKPPISRSSCADHPERRHDHDQPAGAPAAHHLGLGGRLDRRIHVVVPLSVHGHPGARLTTGSGAVAA